MKGNLNLRNWSIYAEKKNNSLSGYQKREDS
jgi:hypothetical protein